MYTAFDLETTIKTLFKRKASPFYNQNKIVAIGYKRKDDEKNTGLYDAAGHKDGWFADLCRGTKFLVGFNVKFDVLHAICQGPINRNAWLDFINDGGQLWDGQLGEYLLYGQSQENQIISMDEVAPRYGGTLKNDAVKALWNAGVDTTEIDRDLLMDYLLGTKGRSDVPTDQQDRGDIGNTEAIFLGQVSALRARGGLQSALLNMGALVYTIEAEYNGMYIDKDKGLALAAELKIELAKTVAELQNYLPADLPFEFKWTSRFHLSALIFGGQIKYVAKEMILDAHGAPTYKQTEERCFILNDGTTTPLPPTDGTVMLYATVKSGKDAGEFKTKKVKTNDVASGPKMRNADFFYKLPGFTTPDPRWESSTPGVYSTASEVIEALGNRDIPFLKALAKRAAMSKDLGTYFITTDEETGESKGMLTMVGDDGLIHHQLHMNRTITGRLSSSDPNLQNVSGSHKSDVKTVFVSRFGGAGGSIIQSDFKSLEIYVQAILTNCQQLLEDLRLGLDMHCVRAHQAWGGALSYDRVKEFAVDFGDRKDLTEEEAALHEVWHYKRKNAKVFSFQRAYGAGVAKIAATTGMTIEEVEALVKAELERYPELDAFIASVTKTIKENRVPTSRFCDHPEVRGLQCQLGRSTYTTPDGKLYSYSESPSPKFIASKPASQGGTPQSFSPTEIKNYIVQGTGGEWAKAAMWLCVKAFYRKRNFDGMAMLVNQVHDANYADAHNDVKVEAAALMHACMLEASTLMDFWFKWKLPIGVPTDTKFGASMAEEQSFDKAEFLPKVEAYRKWVRAEFISNHTPHYERSI